MTIIIEDPETHKFLATDGTWSDKAVDGQVFASTRVACAAGRRESIGRFNVVGYFSDTSQFINMDHGRGKGSGADPNES